MGQMYMEIMSEITTQGLQMDGVPFSLNLSFDR